MTEFCRSSCPGGTVFQYVGLGFSVACLHVFSVFAWFIAFCHNSVMVGRLIGDCKLVLCMDVRRYGCLFLCVTPVIDLQHVQSVTRLLHRDGSQFSDLMDAYVHSLFMRSSIVSVVFPHCFFVLTRMSKLRSKKFAQLGPV